MKLYLESNDLKIDEIILAAIDKQSRDLYQNYRAANKHLKLKNTDLLFK